MSYPQPIQKLINLFMRLPGIGPRQAARFVFYLLNENRETAASFAEAINTLRDQVGFCAQCFKSMELDRQSQTLCGFCRDASRNPKVIMIVEKEADLANIERSKRFDGLYHVLGGTIDPLDSSAPSRLRIRELFERTKKLMAGGTDIEAILATNATTEGDATALYLERVLRPLGIKITKLGRGLTTGTELEYSDEMTIINALANRK